VILDNAAKRCAGDHINGILVEPMAKPGTEMILGMNNDASFGPAILVGMGGIFVEIFKDTALCLAPVSETEARAMVASLKTKALLEGRRGKPPLDTEALVKSILAVSNLATAYKDEILEMDFNPVMLYEQGQGLCVTDAVIVANKKLAL
jgi:acetyltransferase